ncbi:MAG: GtrA family protein [Oscillospiraceae bacterium]|nr:GtrA family protein [Oscillospiraceae bacterium]
MSEAVEKVQKKKKGKKEFFRVIKYFLIAASAGIIELGVYELLDHVTPWHYWPCYLVALVLSVIWNFTFNRKYTFKSANNIPIAMLKVAAYYAVFTPFSTWFGNWMAEDLLVNGTIVTILNMLINGITEFLYQRFFVFGKSIDTNSVAEKDAAKEEKKEAEEQAAV